MQVIPSRVFEPLPEPAHISPGDTGDGGVDHVVDEHAEDEKRRRQVQQGMADRPFPVDRQPGQDEPQHRAPAVPQENLGRGLSFEIVRQETDTGAEDGGADPPQLGLFREKGDGPQEAGHQDGQPGCQPVHPVKEVEGIGDPGHPEDGQDPVGHLSGKRFPGKEMERQTRVDQGRRQDDLDRQPPPRRDPADVFRHAQQKEERRAGHEPGDLHVPDAVGGKGADQADEYGTAPEPRRRLVVDFSPVRPVHGPRLESQEFHVRRQAEGEKGRNQEDGHPSPRERPQKCAHRVRQEEAERHEPRRQKEAPGRRVPQLPVPDQRRNPGGMGAWGGAMFRSGSHACLILLSLVRRSGGSTGTGAPQQSPAGDRDVLFKDIIFCAPDQQSFYPAPFRESGTVFEQECSFVF